MSLTTDNRSERTYGPQREADGSVEPWSSAGDWDRPEWRGANGHPAPVVGHAYRHGFAAAIVAGLPLADALARAEEFATIEARERRAGS